MGPPVLINETWYKTATATASFTVATACVSNLTRHHRLTV